MLPTEPRAGAGFWPRSSRSSCSPCNASNATPDPDPRAGSAGGSGTLGSPPIGGAGSDAAVAPSVDSVCGNGVLEAGEQCDGAADLENPTCQILGLGTGIVRCAACRLDTRECAPARAGCPVDPKKANGTACFDPDLRCTYPPSCGGAECNCVLDDPEHGWDAGGEDGTGGDDAAPSAHFSCAWRAC